MKYNKLHVQTVLIDSYEKIEYPLYMNNQKLCFSKKASYFALFIVGLASLLIYFSTTISSSKTSTNSRAKEAISTFYSECTSHKGEGACMAGCFAKNGKKCVNNSLGGPRTNCCTVPACSVRVEEGMGKNQVLKKLLGNFLDIPKSFTKINRDGIEEEIALKDYTIGEMVSLLPKDHASVSCLGEYVGNIYSQPFLDSSLERFTGYADTSAKFVSPDMETFKGKLAYLCGQAQGGWAAAPSIYDGCNFKTVIKTGALGGIHKCEVFESVSNAYDWLSTSESSPLSTIRTFDLAVFSSGASTNTLKNELCP